MSANRILIVEDDSAITDTIVLNLQAVGYELKAFDNGQDAADYLKKDHHFDLALLDIMLPGLNGFELLSYMQKYDIPVIYMTAKTDTESEVRGLKGGAEDYLVKPFAVAALLVRIEKVLERTGHLIRVYQCIDVILDAENRTVTKSGRKIQLAPLEFDVLHLLMKNKNRTISRNQILDEIWGQDFFGDIRTVDVRVANIRRKLGWDQEIRTISKTGYRLEEPKP